ncbi:hypothetical protein [Novosphingobium sp. GV079]|nr:hypothetical protein [Novosphingobium sp. GV079]
MQRNKDLFGRSGGHKSTGWGTIRLTCALKRRLLHCGTGIEGQ